MTASLVLSSEQSVSYMSPLILAVQVDNSISLTRAGNVRIAVQAQMRFVLRCAKALGGVALIQILTERLLLSY